jgi:hypothetical protein
VTAVCWTFSWRAGRAPRSASTARTRSWPPRSPQGPYDLVVDYLWGAPAEAVFAALHRTGDARRRTRYIQAGMAAGEVAGLPALTLRTANLRLVGSGTAGPAPLPDAAAAYAGLLQQIAAGEITIDVVPVPLADVEKTWPRTGGNPRVVFLP